MADAMMEFNQEMTVEVGAEQFTARAVEVHGAERDRLFDAQARLMPQFSEYKKSTTRTIPVITLERVR